ncbi:MAG: hypothetical protein HQL81_06875 [Magnetococcales bacterium]|nr:hypothetical protein [Magnetococcales bacterium]
MRCSQSTRESRFRPELQDTVQRRMYSRIACGVPYAPPIHGWVDMLTAPGCPGIDWEPRSALSALPARHAIVYDRRLPSDRRAMHPGVPNSEWNE